MTNKLTAIVVLTLAFLPIATFAAGGDAVLEESNIDRDDISSLQRGARNFMNFCSGCHCLYSPGHGRDV